MSSPLLAVVPKVVWSITSAGSNMLLLILNSTMSNAEFSLEKCL